MVGPLKAEDEDLSFKPRWRTLTSAAENSQQFFPDFVLTQTACESMIMML